MNNDTPTFKFCPSTEDHMPVNDGTSTGWDVFIDLTDDPKASIKSNGCASITLQPGDSVLLKLGVRVISPDGWWLQLNPRSSTFAKKHLVSLVGVIDCDYEGTIMLAAKYVPPNDIPLTLLDKEKIAQLIPMQVNKMKAVKLTPDEFKHESIKRNGTRGTGGFGSTGNNRKEGTK